MDNISEDIEELLRVAGTEDAEQTVERLKEKFGAALLAVRSFEKVATGAGETANEQQAQTKELSSRYATQSEAICALFDGAALCASSVEPAAKTVIERLLKTERGERNFSVETGTGNIRTDDEIVALFGTHLPDDDNTGKPAEWLIRLNKPELEHRLQSLLDHMSIQRIAEEKDTDTYVQRLRNAFRRVEKDSEAEATRLSLSLEQAQVCHKKLADFYSVLTHLKRQIIGNTPDPDDPSFLKSESTTDEIRTALNRAWGLTSNGKDFAELIVDFLDHGKTNLENIASQFCHKNTVDRAVEQSVSVAYFEGIKPLFRFLPILWATIVTAITKVVLAQNTALVIHDKTTSILIVTFLLTWGLSVFIGARNRETRMKELQDYTRKNFVALTDPSDAHADTTGPMGKILDTLMLWKQEKALRDAIARGKTLRFPAESVDTIRHHKPLKTQSPLLT